MKKILLFSTICLTLFTARAVADVDPVASTTTLVCEGGNITMPAPPAGTTYEVAYSATTTSTPGTGVTIPNQTTIPTTNGTGYYYVAVKNSTTSCISEWQEHPVYVLKPLSVTVNGNTFCEEEAGTSEAELTSTITNPESATTGISLAYQWYTVTGATETAIASANTNSYTIPKPVTAGNYTYRLRVGYLINSQKYCSAIGDRAITIDPRPATPTITITGNTAETW